MGQTSSKDKRGMPVPTLPVPPGYAYPPRYGGGGGGGGQGYLQAHLAPGFVPQQTYAFPPGFMPTYGQMPMAMPVGFQQPIMPVQMPVPQAAPPQNHQHQPYQHFPQSGQPPQRTATHQPKGIMKNTKKTSTRPAAAPPARPVMPPGAVIPDPPPAQGNQPQHTPVMPTAAASPHMPGSLQRTQTPFQPGAQDDSDDDEDDQHHSPPAHRPALNRRTPTRPTRGPQTRRTQSVNVPRFTNQQPLTRGASLSLNTPFREPPAPPRDHFKDPQNKDVLDRLNRPLEPTQLTRSLTLSALPAQPTRADPPPPAPEPEKKKGSLLRAFSRRSSAKHPVARAPASAPPEIYIYPVPMASGPNSAATTAPPGSANSVTMPVFEGQPGMLPVPDLPNSAPAGLGGHAGGPSTALLFNENTEHAGFLNHSPHRIFHDNVSYPSALHLAEAMKFIPHRRDVAELIRNARDIGEAYAVAAEHAAVQDTTWSARYLEIMEEVLFLKFSQNADLRQLLSDTGDKRLVYNDPDDEYWSNAGGKGRNCLGVLLERVRERLRRQ